MVAVACEPVCRNTNKRQWKPIYFRIEPPPGVSPSSNRRRCRTRHFATRTVPGFIFSSAGFTIGDVAFDQRQQMFAEVANSVGSDLRMVGALHFLSVHPRRSWEGCWPNHLHHNVNVLHRLDRLCRWQEDFGANCHPIE